MKLRHLAAPPHLSETSTEVPLRSTKGRVPFLEVGILGNRLPYIFLFPTILEKI
jgi:hypothetical protein